MAIKIRLARGGSKKRPFYRIVATDSRMPRDGRFIEKLGTYNPLLPKNDDKRVIMNMERVKHWLGLGAKPTDRIQRMLEADGTLPKTTRNNPKKAVNFSLLILLISINKIVQVNKAIIIISIISFGDILYV